jgi:D-3-phosphoglycerate dehydrogenase
MNIIILDDYQDAVRKLRCATRLEPYNAKVFTNTVKGIGQLSVRLRDAEVLVLIRERTQFPRALLEKLPKLRLIVQTGKVGSHIDIDTCTRLGIAVAEGTGSPVAAAELTWALIMAAMRRLPQYIGNLKHGAWQQSGLKAASMPPNFSLGLVLRGRTLGVWGYGKIGQLVAGYGKAFGMQVVVWGREPSRQRALADGYQVADSRDAFFEQCDVLSVHLRLNDNTRAIVRLDDLARMKPTALFVNTSRAELVEENALAWPRWMSSRPSPSCRATRCCAWKTPSARPTSAMWSKTATSCTLARPLTTSSTSSASSRATSSTPRRSR